MNTALTQNGASAASPRRKNRRVSKLSSWADQIWRFEPTAPGQKVSIVDWRIPMPDGTTLCDPKWSDLLESLKCFVWSVHTDARGGRNLSGATLGTAVAPALRVLLPWMSENGYRRVSQLDNEASWEFAEYLAAKEAKEHASRAKSEREDRRTSVWRNLNLLYLFYKQRHPMREEGFEWMTEAPFDRRSPFSLSTREFGIRKNDTHLQPFEDEVAIAVMTSAQRLIYEPADDVIRLTDLYLEAYEKGGAGNHRGPGKSEPVRATIGRRVLQEFEFQKEPTSGKAWCESLKRRQDRKTSRFSRSLDPVQALRRMILDIIHACSITLQSNSALRAGEMAALKAGLDKKTGFPSCVKIRTSPSGLTEMFYIESVEAKVNGRTMEWVIGARPAGSTYVPPPVRAIQVVQRLLEPWRRLGGRNSLFVSFCAPRGLPRTTCSVGAPSTMWFAEGQRNFLEERVDWTGVPKELVKKYKGTSKYRPHRWRRTFALFLLRTSPGLLPAISQHFKHLTLLMTEINYIGNDPELLEALDSVRVQQSVQFFYSAATGKSPMLGKMGKRLAQHAEELRELIEGKSKNEAEAVLTGFVIEHDLRIWDVEHGTCLIALDPMASRCHKLAGTASWKNLMPNFATREPVVCAGCGAYAIGRGHGEYWKARYRTNDKIAQSGRFSNHQGEYRVALNRARQSAAILKNLGFKVPVPLDEFVEEA